MARILAFAALVASVSAAIDWGTQEPRDYQIQYDSSVYGTGAAGSLEFCQKFRLDCINYVGALDYHHNIECTSTSTTDQVWTICGGVHKLPDSDYGDGTSLDFTQSMISTVQGATIITMPTTPDTQYNAVTDASASSVAAQEALTATGGSGEPTDSSSVVTPATSIAAVPSAAVVATSSTTPGVAAEVVAGASSSSTATPVATSSSPQIVPTSTSTGGFISLPIYADSSASPDSTTVTTVTGPAVPSSTTGSVAGATLSASGATGLQIGFASVAGALILTMVL